MEGVPVGSGGQLRQEPERSFRDQASLVASSTGDRPGSEPASEAAERDQALLSEALREESGLLAMMLASVWSASLFRVSLFLGVASAIGVALGFATQAGDGIGGTFTVFALVALPLALLLGLGTFVRSIELQREAYVYITGMNRIRHQMPARVPAAQRYFCALDLRRRGRRLSQSGDRHPASPAAIPAGVRARPDPRHHRRDLRSARGHDRWARHSPMVDVDRARMDRRSARARDRGSGAAPLLEPLVRTDRGGGPAVVSDAPGSDGLADLESRGPSVGRAGRRVECEYGHGALSTSKSQSGSSGKRRNSSPSQQLLRPLRSLHGIP